MKLLKQNKMFGGWVKQYRHPSTSTNTDMTFSLFLPANASPTSPVPCLYYLSGLTCTDENFTTKACAQRFAAFHSIALIAPDTSPRGANIPGEDDAYDFGTGAGFYVNATTDLYKKHYNMFTYVTEELPELLGREVKEIDQKRKSIFGHSMGGHGALICALKKLEMYKSVSAFAPISNPVNCPWGQKAFKGYLKSEEEWKEYDATELVQKYKGNGKGKLKILVDQGTEDEFYKSGQLLPENFKKACTGNGNVELEMRFQEGYDHSYYFIATFVEDHLKFHAKFLNH